MKQLIKRIDDLEKKIKGELPKQITMEDKILERLENLEKAMYAQKDVLTFNEACIYTGLSKSHLYKLTSRQKVPHSKPFGKILYFDRKELNSWLLQNPIATVDELEQQAIDYCYNKKGE